MHSHPTQEDQGQEDGHLPLLLALGVLSKTLERQAKEFLASRLDPLACEALGIGIIPEEKDGEEKACAPSLVIENGPEAKEQDGQAYPAFQDDPLFYYQKILLLFGQLGAFFPFAYQFIYTHVKNITQKKSIFSKTTTGFMNASAINAAINEFHTQFFGGEGHPGLSDTLDALTPDLAYLKNIDFTQGVFSLAYDLVGPGLQGYAAFVSDDLKKILAENPQLAAIKGNPAAFYGLFGLPVPDPAPSEPVHDAEEANLLDEKKAEDMQPSNAPIEGAEGVGAIEVVIGPPQEEACHGPAETKEPHEGLLAHAMQYAEEKIDELGQWAETVNVAAWIDTFEKNLQEALTVLTVGDNKDIDLALKEDLEATANALRTLREKTNGFRNSGIGFWDTVWYVFSLRDAAFQLIECLPSVMNGVNLALQNAYVNAVQTINDVLRALYLQWDWIEINYFLLENSLKGTVLDVAMDIDRRVEEKGYEFMLADKPPYVTDLLSSRQGLRQSGQKTLLFHTILSRRIDSAVSAQDAFFKSQAAKASILYDDMSHIKRTLLQGITSHANNVVKLRLLPILTEDPDKTLETALRALHGNPCANLWHGDTLYTLQRLEKATVRPENRLECIERAIAALKQKRQKKPGLFARQDATAILEDRIAALQQLHGILAGDGMRVSHALNTLHNSKRTLHKTLVTQDAALIKALEDMDACITNAQLGKMPIQYTPQPQQEMATHMEDEKSGFDPQGLLADIQKRIDKLEEARKAFCASLFAPLTGNIKQKKIELLNELRNELIAGHDVEVALDNMARDSLLRKNMHLLFDGKTGKVVKRLRAAALTQKDRIQLVDAAIKALHQERLVPLTWFAITRKRALENHIRALVLLHQGLMDRDDLATAFLKLDQRSQALLRKESAELMERLGLEDALKRHSERLVLAVG